MNSKQSYRRAEAFVVPGCLLAIVSSLVAADRGTVSTRALSIENTGPGIAGATIGGPEFHAPKAFHSFEQFRSPRIKQLREEYQLDEVVKSDANEFRKILELRHWVHTRWPIDNRQQFSGDALAILEKAKTGAGFHCAHAMRVQHAVMTSMGFVARDLGVDRDHHKLGSGHHGVNEVWSNQHAKWVLLDAKYDIHFERDGVPLSALELHEAVRGNRIGDIVKVQGPDRKAVEMKGPGYPESNLLSYWWVSYHVAVDGFTGSTDDSRLVIFDNEAFRETTWFRASSDGLKEHWAYAAKAFMPTSDRDQIEWTPGVPELQCRQIAVGKLDVTFRSVTPNLKAYQTRIDGGPWQPISGDRFRWVLARGENRLEVRTQNQFAVNGPVVTASVSYTPIDGSKPLPAGNSGIASKYVDDVGIKKDPAVIYATSFENGIEDGLKKLRKGVAILDDSSIARTGSSCAQVTATRGKDSGGDLQFTWKQGVEQCFVRFYCYFHENTVTPHHFVDLIGHTPTYKYRWGGGAGLRPPGDADGAFRTTIEPPRFDKPGSGWGFYTYWHEMRSWQTPGGASDGRPNAYYGNNFRPDDQRPFVGREKWICVEIMVKLNTLGKHDGEQAFWIDGKKIGHWRRGSPKGSWIRGSFVTSGPFNKKPEPFEGFEWRTDARLKINRSMLQWYVSDRAAKSGKSDKNIVYFDNYVIATKYIGPVGTKKRKP